MQKGKGEGKDNSPNLLAQLGTFMWHRLLPMDENYGI